MSMDSDPRNHDPFASLPLLIPVPRAAELLGISRAAAYRFASSGALPTRSRPSPGVNDDGRRFLQELPTQRRKDYARAESSIAY